MLAIDRIFDYQRQFLWVLLHVFELNIAFQHYQFGDAMSLTSVLAATIPMGPFSGYLRSQRVQIWMDKVNAKRLIIILLNNNNINNNSNNNTLVSRLIIMARFKRAVDKDSEFLLSFPFILSIRRLTQS